MVYRNAFGRIRVRATLLHPLTKGTHEVEGTRETAHRQVPSTVKADAACEPQTLPNPEGAWHELNTSRPLRTLHRLQTSVHIELSATPQLRMGARSLSARSLHLAVVY